jgi:hypothetical protein
MRQSAAKLLASGALFAFFGQTVADTYKCPQPDGKPIYQNWPCGSKPEVAQKPPSRPDYRETVRCGMANGVTGTLAAVAGQKANPHDCGKR